MGNISTKARSLASQAKKDMVQRMLPNPEPLTPAQQEFLDQLAARDKARVKEMLSVEELNAKDQSLDQFLNRIGTNIQTRRADVPQMRPREQTSYDPGSQTTRTVQLEQSRHQQPTASSGVMESHVLREIYEAKSFAAEHRKRFDIEPYIKELNIDRSKMDLLFETACLPVVRKLPTYGRTLAFGMPPFWWRKQKSGLEFKSEPIEERKMEVFAKEATPEQPQVTSASEVPQVEAATSTATENPPPPIPESAVQQILQAQRPPTGKREQGSDVPFWLKKKKEVTT